MTTFKRSQAKYVKHSSKTTNWPEYEAGLRQRGTLTVWISEDELKEWGHQSAGSADPATDPGQASATQWLLALPGGEASTVQLRPV